MRADTAGAHRPGQAKTPTGQLEQTYRGVIPPPRPSAPPRGHSEISPHRFLSINHCAPIGVAYA
nr:MAG TPA: hypothetical protein [Caudoviricetes sp.]